MASKRAKARSVASKTRSVSKTQEIMAIGDAPVMKRGSNERVVMAQTFNWINALYTHDEIKDFFLKYAKTQNITNKEFKSLASYHFHTIGAISWMLMNNFPDNQYLLRSFDKFMKKIDEAIHEMNNQPEPFVDIDDIPFSKRHRDIEQYMSIYCYLDKDIFEKAWTEDYLTEYLNGKDINASVWDMLQDHYNDTARMDIKDIDTTSKNYAQIKKAYSRATNNCKIMLSIVDRIVQNNKNKKAAVRRPRKAKKIDNSKLVSKMTFQQRDTDLLIESINPETIIGKKYLFIFNTKTRKFGIFQTDSDSGFSIKGTTLQNFDPEKSVCKTIRKPKEQLTDLTKTTIKATLKKFDAIKAVETKLTGRINKDVILLKVL